MEEKKQKSLIYYFVKCNKSNSIFIVIQLTLLFLLIFKKISWDLTEWFEGGNYYFDFLINLFLGSFISIIFYILLVYIPEEKRREKIYEQICYTAGKMYNYLILQTNQQLFITKHYRKEELDSIIIKKDVELLKKFYDEERQKLKLDFEKTKIFILQNQNDFIEAYAHFIKDLDKIRDKCFQYIEVNFYEEIENVVEMYFDIKDEYNFIRELKNKNQNYSYQLKVQEKNVERFIKHIETINKDYINDEWKFYMKNFVLIEFYKS